MTEAEWRAGTAPGRMLYYLCGRSTDRKHRLFACACCRRAWDRLADPRSRAAVEAAERLADEGGLPAPLATPFDAAADAAVGAYQCFGLAAATTALPSAVNASGLTLARMEAGLEYEPSPFRRLLAGRRRRKSHALAHVALLRCVFGDPFRPAAPNRGWLTSVVVAIARGIYEDRAFDHLPVLADALEDAGCEDATLLNHCRAGAVHARGCWAVDLILGRD